MDAERTQRKQCVLESPDVGVGQLHFHGWNWLRRSKEAHQVGNLASSTSMGITTKHHDRFECKPGHRVSTLDLPV